MLPPRVAQGVRDGTITLAFRRWFKQDVRPGFQFRSAAGVIRVEAVDVVDLDEITDAEAVMAQLPNVDDVSYIGLVMNQRGWQRAAETGVDEINIPVFASDTFNEKNQGVSTAESIDALSQIAAEASAGGLGVTATISAAWGCPFEGEVSTEWVVAIAAKLADTEIDELALGDTIGVADPWSVTERIAAVQTVTGDLPLRVHFHNTRNTGIANVHAAIEAGVSVIDAAVGGIGGCPFAPAATGNIATDDLVYMLNRAGFEHGIALDALIGISHEMEEALGKTVPAMLPKAGDFPGGLQ